MLDRNALPIGALLYCKYILYLIDIVDAFANIGALLFLCTDPSENEGKNRISCSVFQIFSASGGAPQAGVAHADLAPRRRQKTRLGSSPPPLTPA